MIRNRRSTRPTPGELALLRVLWTRGPSTVREVRDAFPEGEGTGYTTVLKLLQIMTGKGLVERDDSQRAHVYRARSSEEETQSRLVGDLMDRAFSGSAGKLVVQALSSRPATREELAEIRRMLDALEGEEER